MNSACGCTVLLGIFRNNARPLLAVATTNSSVNIDASPGVVVGGEGETGGVLLTVVPVISFSGWAIAKFSCDDGGDCCFSFGMFIALDLGAVIGFS